MGVQEETIEATTGGKLKLQLGWQSQWKLINITVCLSIGIGTPNQYFGFCIGCIVELGTSVRT